jgi:hypothetical protein
MFNLPKIRMGVDIEITMIVPMTRTILATRMLMTNGSDSSMESMSLVSQL